MAENKKGFVLYCDIIHMVKKLPKETQADLFIMILDYVNDNNPETEDLILNIAFEPIKQQLKRDLIKYEERAERSRLNGLKGGRPPKKPKKPSGLKHNPEKPRKPDIGKDTVTVTVIDKDISVIPPHIENVKKYFHERGVNGQEYERFNDFYTSKGWKVGRDKMKDWKAAVRGWIGRMPKETSKSAKYNYNPHA